MARGEDMAAPDTENARLRERIRLLENAIESMGHGLCMFDPDGRIALSNHRYAEVIGQPADMVHPGMTVRELLKLAVRAGHRPADTNAAELEAALWANIRAEPHARI